MEQWQDQGIVLSARAHGESGAVVSILTENYGRHAGYIRGAHSSRQRGVIEPGNLVGVHWASRVADQLGTFTLEQERNLAAPALDEPLKLAALQSACALCDEALPERESHPGLFYGLHALLESMENPFWGVTYIMWEIALLRELGFALNLTRCAGGGDPATLSWVSPKSGHAVSAEKGAPYGDKLLPLPAFLKPERGDATDDEILKGLRMTAHFLEHWVFNHHRSGVPAARLRFHERFEKSVESTGQQQERIFADGTQG